MFTKTKLAHTFRFVRARLPGPICSTLVDFVLCGSDGCKDEDRGRLIDRSSASKSKN